MIESEKFLTGPQIRSRYNISEMTLWRWLQDEELEFPKPTKINRRRYFAKSEIILWERSRVGGAT